MRGPLPAFVGGAELGCYGTASKHAYRFISWASGNKSSVFCLTGL